MTPKIKILVTYKYRHRVLKSKIITPIQSGRALSSENFEDMIGDDTGDNISAQNNLYSELSALYWAWKNYDKLGNPDYIGHMHYRRQFLFDTRKLKLKRKWISSYYKFEQFNKDILNAFSDKNIKKVVPDYDYLIPDWHNVRSIRPHLKDIKQEYVDTIPGARADIWETFIEICKEKSPEYAEEIEAIDKGTKVLVCNMFIMRKELFFKYCEFAFPILIELVKRVDSTNLTVNGQRFAGYMAEKLLSMYVMKLEKNPTYKEGILTCSYIIAPDKKTSFIEKIFSIRNTDNFYKVITILGFKIKLKQKKKVKEHELLLKINNLSKELQQLRQSNEKIITLLNQNNKVSENYKELGAKNE